MSLRNYRTGLPALTGPVAAAVPWARPQPENPLYPVCPLKGGKLVLALDPAKAASLPSGIGSKVRLQQLSLQFYVKDVGYVGLVLSDTSVSVDTPTDIDLAS